MMNTRIEARRELTMGEAAVEGLLAGSMAGAAMLAYLIVIGLAAGDGSAVAHHVVEVVGRFDPGASGSPLIGLLAHLAVAGVYGALFGGGWRLAPFRRRFDRRLSPVCGLAYGLALWALAQGVLLPLWGSALRAVPPVHFAVAHALYGLTLGLLFRRSGTDLTGLKDL